MVEFRIEKDLLGEHEVPREALYGIHTVRACENFSLAQRPVHPQLIKAYGVVKLAAFRTNRSLGYFADAATADAIDRAIHELLDGSLNSHVVVDALQGGAGTALNMNINEVIANRALQILGQPCGMYEQISPLDHVNLHQSTNDTFPTALRLSAIVLLRRLEKSAIALQESFQKKEKEFAHIVKIGRTEMQDAVLTTLGREMGAYAEAFNRDRWRIYKCEERLRTVNLGGTAIGSGVGAPRDYIFRVVDELRSLTGIGFARAENLIDATQNADVFVEVSGIVKACAVSLSKISNDLRLMSSAPFGEIVLPVLAAGSSIMPGKINPIIPEAAGQAAIMVLGYDVVITQAVSQGTLELNHNLPLIADCHLTEIDILYRACEMLGTKCVDGVVANVEMCRFHVERSVTATATALISKLGYSQVNVIVQIAVKMNKTIREVVLEKGLMTGDEFDEAISPESVCRLGSVSD